MSFFRPCLIVPVFNHGISAQRLAVKVAPLGLPLILVDDGSMRERDALAEAAKRPQVTLLRHEMNTGKGGAVKTALRAAAAQGYTHALQIDADGQHDVEDIPRFLAMAQEEPGAVICGAPRFDETAPGIRRIGRYFTHIWIWIETLSFEIEDSMCGFRVYPLRETLPLLSRTRLGDRMDFDPEILVRLNWSGVPIKSLPTKVIYPEAGSSNFRLVADNALISLMHTKLVLGMIARLPFLLLRKWRRAT